MKFGQLVEFKMRNIFLKKPYIKNMVEKLVLDPFIKKKIKIEHTSRLPVWNVFIVCPSRGLPKHVKTKVLTTCSCHKAFLKPKRGLLLVSLPHFLHDFWIKILLTLYSINSPISVTLLPLVPEILGNICSVIIFSQPVTSWILKLTLVVSSSRLPTWPKIQNKRSNILRLKNSS